MRKPTVRCSIYTRKSSDEGLDQDFNSLDAQHEACAAYIASQRHEGWKMLPARFDDGGISGGTLERPALQRLLAEVDAGRIGMVVVYKIDRLTRSLSDFAKLVDRLDATGCSFVSVTQAFNTSSSMGRLTLNVLLSFAQFEREVTAERIRDKLAASKKKGLWMGGICPLGYDPHPDTARRELVVNAEEARTIRHLFELYARLGRLNRVAEEADRLGLRSKRSVFATGRVQGGTPMSRGQIHRILTNPVYRGMIRHKDNAYPGMHAAIIDEELWARVQEMLQSASAKRRGPAPGQPVDVSAPLKGKVRDATGDLLTPTHCQTGGKRHCCYVSNRLISNGPDTSAWRLPAKRFERAVADALAAHLSHHAARHAIFAKTEAVELTDAAVAINALVSQIEVNGISVAAPLIRQAQIAIHEIIIELDGVALAEAAGLAQSELDPTLLQARTVFRCRRRGVETKIIAGDRAPDPDPVLLDALRRAHAWSERLRSGTSLSSLSKSEKVSERYMGRIIHLSGLSPCLQEAIIRGTQPQEKTLKQLIRRPLALDWAEQEAHWGARSYGQRPD